LILLALLNPVTLFWCRSLNSIRGHWCVPGAVDALASQWKTLHAALAVFVVIAVGFHARSRDLLPYLLTGAALVVIDYAVFWLQALRAFSWNARLEPCLVDDRFEEKPVKGPDFAIVSLSTPPLHIQPGSFVYLTSSLFRPGLPFQVLWYNECTGPPTPQMDDGPKQQDDDILEDDMKPTKGNQLFFLIKNHKERRHLDLIDHRVSWDGPYVQSCGTVTHSLSKRDVYIFASEEGIIPALLHAKYLWLSGCGEVRIYWYTNQFALMVSVRRLLEREIFSLLASMFFIYTGSYKNEEGMGCIWRRDDGVERDISSVLRSRRRRQQASQIYVIGKRNTPTLPADFGGRLIMAAAGAAEFRARIKVQCLNGDRGHWVRYLEA
jgi:hypothetical protein